MNLVTVDVKLPGGENKAPKPKLEAVSTRLFLPSHILLSPDPDPYPPPLAFLRASTLSSASLKSASSGRPFRVRLFSPSLALLRSTSADALDRPSFIIDRVREEGLYHRRSPRPPRSSFIYPSFTIRPPPELDLTSLFLLAAAMTGLRHPRRFPALFLILQGKQRRGCLGRDLEGGDCRGGGQG